MTGALVLFSRPGIGMHLLPGVVALIICAASSQGAAEPGRSPAQAPPPPPGLHFSPKPSVKEISSARVFDEPLVPIGAEPDEKENSDLTAALLNYSRRTGPDDFESLENFLQQNPGSGWAPSLLTGLGLEYYNTAHYTLALDAWARAWSYEKEARDAAGYATMNRAAAELAYLYARLGRMTELEALLNSVENRFFFAGNKEKLDGAREALWVMQNRPEVAFRCGPLALHRIKLATDPTHPCTDIVHQSASTQKGFSLPQVAEISRKLGLNYQMAFRGNDGDFVVPAVVHWKAGHYAAIVRKSGDRYLVEDPTFGNTVWPTRQALEAETSGYFLIPPGDLPRGWRKVEVTEGERVWGKGQTAGNDADVYACTDAQSTDCGPEGCSGNGMAVSSIHLMVVNLQIRDHPIGYRPPVGPPIDFTVRFNSRSTINPNTVADLSPLGSSWTHDWAAWIVDQPQSPQADVKYYVGGGGVRTFTGFNPTSQSFSFQQYDQTLLTRTGTNSYEMVWPDGSKKVFAQPDGAAGSTRRVYLTQVVDSAGNSVSLGYDSNLRLMTITDALGQVTTLSYDLAGDFRKITRVTDPFGRYAQFGYREVIIGYVVAGSPPVSYAVYGFSLQTITDVLGLTSEVRYLGNLASSIDTLITPYGTNTYSFGGSGTTRFAEARYPDGSRERVEYNQSITVPGSEPTAQVPQGMGTLNSYLNYRNTYYWNRNACASGYGDYTKAQLFHWLHTADMSTTAGILESTKQPLEGRVWRDYAGQSSAIVVGTSDRPSHVGRVLDDGSTQLYTYRYNGFGHPTNTVDPVGRTFSYVYATNGLDLLEIRQTRGTNNELLASATYNAQHRPLSIRNASGHTNSFTWNARGQRLTSSNPKGETVTYNYDTNGYLLSVDGPLPGDSDSVIITYDSFGRPRTLTDLDGDTLTLDYDAMDRITRINYPDGTYTENVYDRLSLSSMRDRAGRITSLEYNSARQPVRKTDPLGRVTHFDWCSCGSLKSLTDPMGRTTSWLTDVQGRRIGKLYPDGSLETYAYENTTSRLRLVTDGLLQTTMFAYNRDNTFRSVSYGNSSAGTPPVVFAWDPNYERTTSVTDGSGTTLYAYNPISGNTPSPGAGRLASEDGPLAQDTITFGYDELGRAVGRAINGSEETLAYDVAGRVSGQTNALGVFAYGYDGDSARMVSQLFPNGLAAAISYGGTTEDFELQQIGYSKGGSPVSQFGYGHDLSRGQITSWSQQADAQPPSIFTFGYDAANQLISALVTNAGAQVASFAYSYDLAGNRLSEQSNGSNFTATYNALNQITTSTAPGASRTNEWDAAHRLTAVNNGSKRTEFRYDGRSRLVAIRHLTNGVEVSRRLFVWIGGKLKEERATNGSVVKRFFGQGVQIQAGNNAGTYYYTRDHLGSIREITDASGAVRARYTYDAFGRRTKVSGDLDADFGFAGMFWCPEANLAITRYRAYDPELGRWLSRDPLKDAELNEGPNLYAYVRNNPVNLTDTLGLCTGSSLCACTRSPAAMAVCEEAGIIAGAGGGTTAVLAEENLPAIEALPAAAAEAPAALECAAPRVAQVVDVLETRIAALEASFPEIADEIAIYKDSVGNPNSYITGWLTGMIRVDRMFFETAEIMAERFGISFEDAWLLLAKQLGFNPELW